MNWYAIYTKPKNEDIVSMNLRRIELLEVFNPKIKRKRLLKENIRDEIIPLFPCYIFAKFNETVHSRTIKWTRGVRRVVGSDVPWPVAEEIIEIIKRKTENGWAILSEKFKTGDLIQFEAGPLKDLRGIFERELSDTERVVILLNAIEYSARVTVDKAYLRKV